MIEPNVCIETPYRPRLIHSGAQHLSGRAQAVEALMRSVAEHPERLYQLKAFMRSVLSAP
jgi:hypothetical protein